MIIYQHGTIKNYRYIGDVSGDHVEAALTVLDKCAEGVTPPALHVLRRILHRHLEGLEEIHLFFA